MMYAHGFESCRQARKTFFADPLHSSHATPLTELREHRLRGRRRDHRALDVAELSQHVGSQASAASRATDGPQGWGNALVLGSAEQRCREVCQQQLRYSEIDADN